MVSALRMIVLVVMFVVCHLGFVFAGVGGKNNIKAKSVNVLVVGESGSGKSSLIRMFTDNENLPEVLPSVEPNTKFAQISKVSKSFENKSYKVVNFDIIDTIGYGSSDTDAEVVKQLKDAFTNIPHIDFVIVLFKAERYNQNAFEGFSKLLKFLKNVGFTDNNVIPYITKLNDVSERAKDHYMKSFIKRFGSHAFITESSVRFANFMDLTMASDAARDTYYKDVEKSYDELLNILTTRLHYQVRPIIYIKCLEESSMFDFFTGYNKKCVEKAKKDYQTFNNIHAEL